MVDQIFFYKFLECVKSGQIADSLKSAAFIPPHETDLMMNAVPFIFTGDFNSKELDIETLKNPKLDLPFKSVWFEHSENTLFKIFDEDKPEKEIHIIGFHIEELSPEQLKITCLYSRKTPTPKTLNVGLIRFPMTQEYAEINTKIFSTAANLIQMLNTQTLGSFPMGATVKYKQNGENKFRKINKIIYVSTKKEYQKAETHAGRTINWTHSWAVRGHWRKIQSIGKDREGVYQMKGFTWIKDFKKGTELPFVEKMRIVK
jgi:hypothetical protein